MVSKIYIIGEQNKLNQEKQTKLEEIEKRYLDNNGRSTEISTYGLNPFVIKRYFQILSVFEDFDQLKNTPHFNGMEQNFLFSVIYNYISNGISQTDAQYVTGQLTGLITELSKKYKDPSYVEEKIRKIKNVFNDYYIKEVSTT